MHTNALRTPADIIAAAPGLLGFAPTDSVVTYLLRRHVSQGLFVRCAIRFDVTINTTQAANFPTTCNLRAGDNHAAILLGVCEPGRDEHARTILDALRDALHTAAIPVLARLLTRDVTTAGQWVDLDSGQSGPTYPYTDALLTAQRVGQGERVSPHRGDIEAEFATNHPAPPVEVADHGELLTSTAREIAQALAGTPSISDTLATRAGILITGHPARRDAMLGLAVEHPQAAADLWTHLARQLRGQPRAQALTVAGVCYCLLGDTVRAGIAAEAALEEAERSHTPAPRLAHLLLAALHAGIPPTQINTAIAESTLKTGDKD
jgi:hypothetical protein